MVGDVLELLLVYIRVIVFYFFFELFREYVGGLDFVFILCFVLVGFSSRLDFSVLLGFVCLGRKGSGVFEGYRDC